MDDDFLDTIFRNNEPPEEGEGPRYPFSIQSVGNDHHFGMEAKSSGTSVPYTNRGRGELLWKTLIAYGFERVTDSKGKHSFKDKIPHPCFEYSMRIHFKNNGKEYKWPRGVDHATGYFFVNYDIPALAGSIHSSLMNGGAPGYSHVDKFDDALLVRSACSLEGLLDSTGFESRYYCFCVNQMVCPTHIWHCKVCHKCRDWKTWHCAGCDCCKDGCTIPCDVCSPDMYRSRMEAG